MNNHKDRVRDKYWDENKPTKDFDYVEAVVSNAEFDKLIQTYARTYIMNAQLEPEYQMRSRKKKDRLLRKIFQAAAKGLTKKQFQIFVSRYVLAKKEIVIAKELNVGQSYVSQTLTISHKKIQRFLRLIKKTPRKKHAQSKKEITTITTKKKKTRKSLR